MSTAQLKTRCLGFPQILMKQISADIRKFPVRLVVKKHRRLTKPSKKNVEKEM
jgi:hypothetical protein